MRVILIALSAHSIAARLLHSLPDDIYAFPKYRVSFLNGLPVHNNTAQHWLNNGLRGGQAEFIDHPYNDVKDDLWRTRKEIDSGPEEPLHAATTNYTLEHMRMGKDSYICLIPQQLDTVPHPYDEVDSDTTPARSWSLLQPLTGSCLYHRQGWFTYSYCHNQDIRQFKELIPPQSRTPGPYTPEEDPEWESYTLGRAPTIPEPGVDLTVAEQNAQAVNLQLARGAGSRYLVQRWGDGTLCDKTGKSREVEVQFHCSMVMSDHILFVKEAKTCSYVLVIHTPRLCGEPGFKSQRDAGEEALIYCREVVDKADVQMSDLPQGDHPFKIPLRKPFLPAPPLKQKSAGADAAHRDQEKLYADLFRKTLDALMSGKEGDQGILDQDADLVIEIEDDDVLEDGHLGAAGNRLLESLRAAGFDVRAELVTAKLASKEKDNKADEKPKDNKREDRRSRIKKLIDEYNEIHDEL